MGDEATRDELVVVCDTLEDVPGGTLHRVAIRVRHRRGVERERVGEGAGLHGAPCIATKRKHRPWPLDSWRLKPLVTRSEAPAAPLALDLGEMRRPGIRENVRRILVLV